MMVVPTRETGITDDGMDLEHSTASLVTHMRENINSINVMDMVRIGGPMGGCIVVSSAKGSVMGLES
jgi:hypothetical protein